jgi:hypothetical protein
MTIDEIVKLQRHTEQYGAVHAGQVQQTLTIAVLEVARQLAELNEQLRKQPGKMAAKHGK